MNTNLKTMLTMAGAVVVGFIVHKMVANFFGMPDATESFASASGGISCMCKRADGSYKQQDCRTKYTTCEECCGHYGYETLPFGY